ncbi:MAG: glucose-6-phosphate isomerase [Bacteroidetes bacterium GWF2_42_66]|nr:MAG: glucose-6-phosphate isomerase [Bacteroidetes bacterium GWA2_42_15]OFY01465.1 MAG: glucose-6-phosphate isomerase [Bacteroidetes bacterium GWE2_42_39]OFY43354.1 MAG: glucose-6-phosphate isomerase [Bacteroidetes bacterium GWF2_42_66]HBL77463.1 glucose-6-phosphate isomerase [Prolixibacteraceae bacterium]HCR91819.1 glucose-6-phosphate isomerase [Prolixibacteraceae bacterium]
MEFNPGFDIKPTVNPMGFLYGNDVFGPQVENRRLDDIRKSLRNPGCEGPETVYSIAMDVGKKEHLKRLEKLHLLFGVVTYAAGRLGDEPVRSQGHIHKVSPLSGWSTPEVYEIWSGRAIIYMQETAKDNPGHCFAVEAGPGEVVVVPPYWAHVTVSADAEQPLTFGAWCDRAYGFQYDDVRAHNGLAWFPIIQEDGTIGWLQNPAYNEGALQIKSPSDYSLLGIEKGKPIYTQFEEDESRFLFVPHPALKRTEWKSFIP